MIHHQVCDWLPTVYSMRWCQLGVCSECRVHTWGTSIRSHWVYRLVVVEIVWNCAALKTRWRDLGWCHWTSSRNMFLVTVVAVLWKTRSYFLTVFGTSIFKPDLKRITNKDWCSKWVERSFNCLWIKPQTSKRANAGRSSLECKPWY